jgi:hypothetical protein
MTTPGAIRRKLVLAVLFVAGLAVATPFDLAGHDWEGCADFVELARREIGAGRVVATTRLDMHELKREDGVILLHPERSLDVDGFSRFMRAGGRVVLLDDFGMGDALLEHFAMERIAAPRRPAEALRGNPQLAIAEPASAHPVALDITRLVTNHPTGIKASDLSPVLKIRAIDAPEVLLAVAGLVGQPGPTPGRLLAVGDPSLVMNSMLRYPGNRTFARNIVRYVSEDDTWGKRTGRVFILAGPFDERGAFGEESVLGDEWGSRFRAIRDFFADLRHDGMGSTAAYILAVFLGLGTILWIGQRAGRLHKPVAPRLTRPIPLVAQGGLAGHAAVVAAPTTSRVLAMMELKSALVEELCMVLGLEERPMEEAILAELRQRGLLDAEGLHKLRQLLLRLSNIETMVLSQRAAAMQPIRDREVLYVANAAKGILEQIRQRLAVPGVSGVSPDHSAEVGPTAIPDIGAAS